MPHSAIDQPDTNSSSLSRVDSCDIEKILHDLFKSMLNMELDSVPESTAMKWDEPVVASINIEGDWNAEVRIVATQTLAAKIGSSMFGMNADEISQAEIFDAMGEVVNVVGGNAKGIAKGKCRLSIPRVGIQKTEQMTNTLSAKFGCENLPLEVQLIFEN